MICSLPVALAFAGDVLHFPGRQELAFLDVDRLAGLRDVLDEVGLAAQEGRGLQHVDHARHLVHRRVLVHVGQHGHAELTLHFGEHLEAFLEAGAAEARTRGAVCLVEARLEDEVRRRADR